jgi:hypothetical protein
MKRRSDKRFNIRLLAAVLAFSAILACHNAAAQQTPKVQIFGGYSYLRFDSTTIGFAETSNMNGWEFSPAFNFTKHLGVVADASGHYGNHQQFYAFSAGPQVLFTKGNGLFFGHLLFGKGEDKVRVGLGGSSNARAIIAGVGYDHGFTDRLAFRVAQVDYVNTQVFNNSQKNLRVSVGVVYHWGDRKK